MHQKKGDMLYLPEGWHHATFNDAETVAVSFLDNELVYAQMKRGGSNMRPSRL